MPEETFRRLREISLRELRLLTAESIEAGNLGRVKFSVWAKRVVPLVGRHAFLRAYGVVKRMESQGDIVFTPLRLEGGHDSSMVSLGRPLLTNPDLASLLAFAEDCIDETLEVRGGRRTSSANPSSREVLRITGRQFKRCETAASVLAKGLIRDGSLRGTALLSRVDAESYPEVFGWDDAGDQLHGWAGMERTIERVAPGRQLSTHKGALSLLLDLCATHAVLYRPPIDPAILPTTPGWLKAEEAWAGCFSGNNGSKANLGRLFMQTFLAVCGEEEEEPLAVIYEKANDLLELLKSAYHSGTYRPHERVAFREVLKRAVAHELLPDDALDLSDFDRSLSGIMLWPVSVSRRLAEAQFGKWDERQAVWKELLPFNGLVDRSNHFSLACTVDFFTARGTQREGMPSLACYPRPRRPRNARKDGSLWAKVMTAEGNIIAIAQFLGIIMHYKPELQTESMDLKALFTKEHLVLVQRAHRDGLYSPSTLRNICIVLGLVSSPYLERMAWDDRDYEQERRFHEFSSYASGHGELVLDEQGEYAIGAQNLASMFEQVTDIKAQGERAREIQAAWVAGSGYDWAYEGMVAVRTAARMTVFRSLEVESWDDIDVAGLREAELIDVQALALWNDQLGIPFRALTLILAELKDRAMRKKRSGETVLQVKMGVEKFKREEPGEFAATMWREGSKYDIGLWNHYRDGVRLAMVGSPDEGRVWVSTGGNTISRTTLNDRFRRVLELAAQSWKLLHDDDTAELDIDALIPVSTSHCFRHALGSYYVNVVKDPQAARQLLHHSGSSEALEKIYAVRDPSTGADDGLRMATQTIEERRAEGSQDAFAGLSNDEVIERLMKERPDLVQRLVAEAKKMEDAA